MNISPQIRMREPSKQVQQPQEADEDELVELVGNGETPSHLTKNGTPDRRYKGFRDLPEESVINPQYRKATRGFVDAQGVHRTKDGKPDRRYLESRTMSDDEAAIQQAEYFLAKRKEQSH